MTDHESAGRIAGVIRERLNAIEAIKSGWNAHPGSRLFELVSRWVDTTSSRLASVLGKHETAWFTNAWHALRMRGATEASLAQFLAQAKDHLEVLLDELEQRPEGIVAPVLPESRTSDTQIPASSTHDVVAGDDSTSMTNETTASSVLKKIQLGVLVTVVLAIIGFAFWFGGLQTRMAVLEGDEAFKKQRDRALAEIRAAVESDRKERERPQAPPDSGRPNESRILVSASQLWVDSGIDVKPGTRLHVSASGLVNLAIHRTIIAADRDEHPPLRWSGPDGTELPDDRPLYVRRQRLLPYPEAPYGTLLMYLRPAGDADPSKYNPAPSGIQKVGHALDFTYSSSATKSARLFFCVNDTYLKDDPTLLKAYAGTQQDIDKTYGPGRYTVAELEARWRRLIDQKYWEIWFDDNVGYFLVEMRLETP